jgi:PAS domain S-box-containing protein
VEGSRGIVGWLRQPRHVDAADVGGEPAAASLAESESRYRLLAENSTDVISVVDAKGVLQYMSPACRTLVGFEPEDLIGHSGYEFIHPDDIGVVAEAHASLLDDDGPSTSPPYRIRRKDGTYVWIESTVRAIRDPDSDEIVEFQSSARDITVRRQAEEALEHAHTELKRRAAALERSNVELEQFAYDASHDLGEPLRILAQLTARLCAQWGDTFDEGGRRMMRSIVDGVDRMQTLVADLLEYSRASREPLELEPLDCSEVVRQTLELLEESISEKAASVSCGELPTVRAHLTQLGQVFQNLISNALKFTKSGDPPRVHVSAEREAEAWRFLIRDNGIGIDPGHSMRVFEMFRRLHPDHTYAGTGMGLSICKRIVENHGGRIWAAPAEGVGTVFHFTIPDEPLG